MAIQAGDVIHKFDTQVAVISQSAPLSSGAMSVAADATTWTNTDDVPKAAMVIVITFAAAPAENGNVQLFGRKMGVFGANNSNEPSLSFEHTNLGVFPVDTTGAQTILAIEIELPNAETNQEWDFYIKNNTNQSASTFSVYLTPLTVGPKP